jgi:Ribosomal L29 protein
VYIRSSPEWELQGSRQKAEPAAQPGLSHICRLSVSHGVSGTTRTVSETMAGLMMSPTLQCSRCSFAGQSLRKQMAAPASARCRTPLAVEAKRSKAADFRGLSQEQIQEQVQEAKRGLFDLRIKQRTKQVRAGWPDYGDS